MTVVDFMSIVRKLPMKKMGLDTFGDIAECLSNIILATCSESTRIDNIFNVYQNASIKQIERAQRKSSEQIKITIRSDNQKVPVDIDMFCSSMVNQVRLQEYFFQWILKNVSSKKKYSLEEYMMVNAGKCWLALKRISHICQATQFAISFL